MILKENSTNEKLRGAYYTPLPLVKKMIDLFKEDKKIHNILEPSCGDGVFVKELVNRHFIKENNEITAIEINNDEAEKLRKSISERDNVSIINGDFFEFYYKNIENKKYDLILGNPPYIRYQYLEESQRKLMSDILTSNGMKANKLVNAWVGFLVACIKLLNDEGKIAFVIPAEILQVAYAEDLRLYLANNLSEITLITFEELVFPDIEQEVVILVGKKGKEEKGIRIIELNSLSDLEKLEVESHEFQKLQHVHEKWTKYFITPDENELIKDIKNDSRFQKMSDVALINVGITTGNNKYFSITKDIVDEYKFENVVKPLIGRSSHINSVFFDEEQWNNNIREGKKAYLLDFPDIPYELYPNLHKKYIELGEKNEENTGYKCSIRDRWYRIPSIWVPDAFFLRRNNLYPKFILNECNAVSTDTMHRIKFNEGIQPEAIVLSYYNSISFAFTEICGRSYGGGVLEILPGEVGNIFIPKLHDISKEEITSLLNEVDNIIKNNINIERALDIIDKKILVDIVGIDETICIKARMIWKKMQRRRLNRG